MEGKGAKHVFRRRGSEPESLLCENDRAFHK